MAQRMESVAPPGGVMLSESTARLVEAAAVLGERQLVHIKGSAEAVPAHLLLAVGRKPAGSAGPIRLWWGANGNCTPSTRVLDRSFGGQGCVVGVAGPAGIGKSRLVQETVAMACPARVPGLCDVSANPTPATCRFMWWRGCCGSPTG